ncbi:uncharacterized protein LOC120645766 [Panicum virgatum]|uniref:uncharacterized protein LOC120645766 n=1 Tax=Panicum virgatum TaxID=38727 RepID=UPI0019D550E9|nr:uncharacterized protein LOC120645766 [Panicum virgatum]
MSTGGDESAASVETSAQMASRPQPAPRVTPLDQVSRGVGVPQARSSGAGKRSMSARSGAVAKDAAPLAPVKALKTGARAIPHMAPQPLPVVDIVAEAAKLQAAMAQGTQAAQQALAPGNGGDAGQSGAETAAPADAMGEAGRGGADDAARPVVEAEVGWTGADSTAWPVAEEGSGGGAQERPASQTEAETLVPGPPGAGVEGAAEEKLAPRAPVAEEARVSGPTEARDESVVALPDSSGEYGDSRDIDPADAASAADKIAEFTSACVEVLDKGTTRGPQHGAIIQSVVPPELLRNERDEEAVWQAQFEAGSQIQNHLERALELHRMTDYQISQRAAAEHKAREAKAQTAELQYLRTTLEKKARETEAQTAELQCLRTALEQKETELLQNEVTIVTLSGTLQEKGEALEEKEVAI